MFSGNSVKFVDKNINIMYNIFTVKSQYNNINKQDTGG